MITKISGFIGELGDRRSECLLSGEQRKTSARSEYFAF
jgi:hypothetical protein